MDRIREKLRFYRAEVGIIGVTTVVILLTLVMAAQVYRVAVAEVAERHKLLAVDLAREAAIGMEGTIDFLSRDLRLVAALQQFHPRSTPSTADNMAFHVRLLLSQAGDLGLRGISIVSAEGRALFTSLPEEVARLRNDHKLWQQLRDPTNRDKVVAGTVQPLDGQPIPSLRLFLATPLYGASSSGSAEHFQGAAVLHVDLGIQIRRLLAPITTRRGIETWILAGDGTLIYHPKHPEMMFRRPDQAGEPCLRCHDNFAAQQAMAASESWSGTYRAGNRGLRVAASHRMRVATDVWSVVVSAPMSAVRVLAGNRFWLFFVLVGIAVVAPAAAAALLLRTSHMRAKAEAEAQQSAELRRLEQEVNQASRLASIGEMVDSVAHEINNPAAVALSRCDYVLEELDNGGISSAELRQDLVTVRKQIQRIVGITQQLLRFSRRLPYNPRAVEVREVVDNAVELLEPRLQSQPVRLVRDIDVDLPPVWGDSQQLEQVLINLLQNALDATAGKEGEVRIAAEEHQENGAPYIVLSVEDNGRGIPRDRLDRIFEPFYTTKPPGKGTGLGLAISQRIVKRHGGRLEVESTPQTGSRFRVWLPVARKHVQSVQGR